jgi:chromosome partitioning protein
VKRLFVWGRKGGSGKTTLAASLGVEASAHERVVLIDTDPQGSLAAWSRKRAATATAKAPLILAASMGRLGEALQAAETERFDLAIVDMPGALSASEARALDLADLVLAPIRPSALDYAAAISTLDVLAAAKVPCVVALVQVRPIRREADEIRGALVGKATVLGAEVGARIAFADAVASGQGVTEYEPRGQAADEIRTLYAEIRSAINAT